MAKGFCMLSKELLDSEYYFSERFTRMQAYLDLCLLAEWKDRKFIKRGQVVELKAGQLAKSEEELADRWKWSRNTVRKYLNEQQTIGNIEQQKSRLITIITVKFGLNVAQQIEQQTPLKPEQQIEQPTIENNKESIYKEKIVKKKEELDLSIVDEQYLPIVNDWLQYKKERKEGYKPTGFKTFYNHLIKLSNNNPVLARKIVDKSMSSNYAGIFELKESDVKAEETESREYTSLEKFIKWVKEGYPTIREMEMPNEEQLNEIIRISGSNMIWYFDQLQDYYHEGSLYELFMERFGGNR